MGTRRGLHPLQPSVPLSAALRAIELLMIQKKFWICFFFCISFRNELRHSTNSNFQLWTKAISLFNRIINGIHFLNKNVQGGKRNYLRRTIQNLNKRNNQRKSWEVVVIIFSSNFCITLTELKKVEGNIKGVKDRLQHAEAGLEEKKC